ncbi:MAG: OmpA family protein [Gallionellaceae bacterium]|jgi:outer membrane protein OmpA-like peptidoglycan-associated protein|nr:OmpA family protein [Gallionellaceae bacterium]
MTYGKLFAICTALALGACTTTTNYGWVEVNGPKQAPAPVVVVEAQPQPVDSDGDGVFDDTDQCPNTPRGTPVDATGCSCKASAQLQFAFNKAELTEEDRNKLDALIAQVGGPQFVSGEVAGHTDSIGSQEYNLKLSLRRAQAAVDYLVARGATRSSIKVSGKGYAEPVADNSTAEGRAQNRRVTLTRTDCGGQ